MKRIDRIKNRLFEKEFMTKKDWWGDGETILNDDSVLCEPLIVRKALAIRHVAHNMPIEIKADELIVGVPTMASVGFGRCFPEYALKAEKDEASKSSFTDKTVLGHHPADYEKILRLGLKGVRSEIYSHLSSASEPEKMEFYRAALISINAVGDIARRYSQLLIKTASAESDPLRKAELLNMSSICSRVPEEPATGFHEALQAVWMLFTAFHSTMELLPIGRSDQYLYPYFEKDISEGKITREYADELVASWLAKFSERVHLNPHDWELHMESNDMQFLGAKPEKLSASVNYANDDEYNYGTSANHWLMNMILGGQTADGRDATNELTYIILNQWSYLELVAPVMSVRFHRNSPEELYSLCASILRRGAGEPVLYNDEVLIPALVKLGIPIEDARNYSNDGCWETLIPGKTYYGFHMHEVLQMLEYLMQDGYSLVRGRKERFDIVDIRKYKTFEEFYQAFLSLLAVTADEVLNDKLRFSQARYKIAPSPLLSAFMDDCLERGLECSNGGAKYSIFTFFICGFANCVDSLAVIKKLVYEDNVISMSRLASALKNNFKDEEPLRQMALNTVPKYGNDDDYTDAIAQRFAADYAEIIHRLREKNSGGFLLPTGVATFEFYAKWGHDVGASADGRLAQAAFGSNVSPSIGADKCGPTAAILSAARVNAMEHATGAELDLQLNPNETAGEQGLARIIALIKSFMELGGSLLTITGVNDEMLRKAQEDPMNHKSLRVRLGGLSAYFITLSKEMQENLINRTKHDL